MRSILRVSSVYPVVLGFLSSIPFNNILISEIIATLYCLLNPIVFLQGFQARYCRVSLVALSSVVLLISSLVNETPADSTAKGVTALILFTSNVLFLTKTFTKDGLWLATLSYLIGTVSYSSFTGLGELDIQADFKFVYSSLAIFLINSLTIAPFAKKSRLFIYFLVVAVNMIIFFLALWGNLRLLIFCSGFAFLSWFAVQNRVVAAPIRSSRSVLILAGLFPILLVSSSIITSLLTRSMLEVLQSFNFISRDALVKSLEQSSGAFGIIFGGRTELFASISAWIEKPLLGWGAWPIDPQSYFAIKGFEIMTSLGYQFNTLSYLIENVYRGTTLPWIPTHSFLFQALVWSGFLGFIPIYIFVLSFIVQFFNSVTMKTPFFWYFMHFLLLWSFLFSPFGWPNRINAAMMLSLLIAHANSQCYYKE